MGALVCGGWGIKLFDANTSNYFSLLHPQQNHYSWSKQKGVWKLKANQFACKTFIFTLPSLWVHFTQFCANTCVQVVSVVNKCMFILWMHPAWCAHPGGWPGGGVPLRPKSFIVPAATSLQSTHPNPCLLTQWSVQLFSLFTKLSKSFFSFGHHGTQYKFQYIFGIVYSLVVGLRSHI